VHLEIAVVAVGLAGQQRFHLGAGDVAAQRFDGAFRLGDDIRVILAFPQFEESGRVIEAGAQGIEGGEAFFQPGALTQDFLRGVGILPKIGVFRLPGQFSEAFGGGVVVKDASLSGRARGRFRRPWRRFRRA
jgi:hypothetical protein